MRVEQAEGGLSQLNNNAAKSFPYRGAAIGKVWTLGRITSAGDITTAMWL